jgi:O-antigen/teichoic acid export membrane protein
MDERPIMVAGKALIWQSLQMGGVKVVFMIRLLVLARLLTPEDFGLVAIATTALGFLLNLTNFGMVPALVQAQKPDETSYDVAWTINFTRSFVVSILIFSFAPIIAEIFAEPRATIIIQILALNPLIEAMTSIKVAALNRALRFRPLATLKIVEALVNAVLAIALATQFGVWGLVIGMLGGTTALVVTSYFIAPYRPRFSFDRQLMKPLVNFGRWIFYTSVIAIAGSFVLRIVISRELGAAELGIYFLAAQLAFLPSEIASEVVGTVAFPLFARLQSNTRQAAQVFQAILAGLAALLLPMCALIIVLSPVLVQEVLGSKWAGTEPVIQILAIVTILGLFSDATIPLLKGLGQPDRITQIELLQTIMIISLVWLLTSNYGLIGAALAWIPASILVQLLCFYFIKNIFHDASLNIKNPLLAIILATIAGASAAALIISRVPNIFGLVVASIIALIIITLLLWISDKRYSLGLIQNMTMVFPQFAPFFGKSYIKINKTER